MEKLLPRIQEDSELEDLISSNCSSYSYLHIITYCSYLCDCKRLTALHSSPRVSYEHARSPIQTAQAVFGCNCLLNDRSDENISSIHSIFVYRSNEKQCRLFNQILSENLSVDAGSRAKLYKNSLGKPMLFPRNLLYASQNKSKLFQSHRSLEGVKDMDTLVILVAASANLSSVLERQVNFLRLWLCNFNCCTL